MSLIALLRDGVDRAADQPLIVTRDRTINYRQVLARSGALARGLHARGITRFACVIADAADLIPLLCAASAAGTEACVFPYTLDDVTIDEYLEIFEQQYVVADRTLVVKNATVISLDSLGAEDGGALPEPASEPVLILTTGTTGRPKGVRYDWSRLIAAARHPDKKAGARWLLAYNLNQFAGIQVLLHALSSRATIVVPPNVQPRDALEAMREFDVTHVSATPTFWRVVAGLLDEATAGEMPLRQITLGGEASPGPLLERLSRLFPDARITHVYAGTEFGAVVSVSDGRAGLPLSVLERGDDAPSNLRIVDGELQIRSRDAMSGYHGGGDVAVDWRPTGDLVEVRDERIVFVGRTGDTINVGGVKVHPLPIEELVGAVEGVQLVKAYGRPNPVTGEIVSIDVVAAPGADLEQLERDIRAACGPLLPAARPRRIRFVNEIGLLGSKIARGDRPG